MTGFAKSDRHQRLAESDIGSHVERAPLDELQLHLACAGMGVGVPIHLKPANVSGSFIIRKDDVFDHREFVTENGPDSGEIYVDVVVRQDISHADQLRPRHPNFFITEGTGKPLHTLGKLDDSVDGSVLDQPVRIESRSTHIDDPLTFFKRRAQSGEGRGEVLRSLFGNSRKRRVFRLFEGSFDFGLDAWSESAARSGVIAVASVVVAHNARASRTIAESDGTVRSESTSTTRPVTLSTSIRNADNSSTDVADEGVTRRSMSLSNVSWRRATDPNTRTLLRPYFFASATILSRCSSTISEGKRRVASSSRFLVDGLGATTPLSYVESRGWLVPVRRANAACVNRAASRALRSCVGKSTLKSYHMI